MQHGPQEIQQRSQPTNSQTTSPASQHGSASLPPHHGSSGTANDQLDSPSSHSSLSRSSSGFSTDGDAMGGVNANHLDEKLRRLNAGSGRQGRRRVVPGQRVWDYENALAPSTPRQPLGFKVVKRPGAQSEGLQLAEFPNEILTHILSHLHPDSHSAVALVSKRFYALVTTPHAWRMAFTRYFPGHDSLGTKSGKNRLTLWDDDVSEFIKSETRYFARLTPLATWRSEYLLRTRLLRSLARGKPGMSSGGIGSSARTSQSSKKSSAVLTYNSKLPWIVTNIHAVFSNGKKPPRTIHGAADIGIATISDPTNGKVEKWGLEDPVAFAQLDEVFPDLEPYGLGDGPAAVPNVADVSQPYGLVAGEGFPGGRPFFRATNEHSGRYLGQNTGVVDTYPDIPKVPEVLEAICSVWIAKSSAVPTVTQSAVGILTGSTLGIVTAYAVGCDSNGSRFSNGDMTARWVLSPGVPIISLRVDDHYTQKRKTSGRVWAVALNALGEVFYLTECPSGSGRAKGDDITKNAWYAGRSAYWQLIEPTRRQAHPDDSDKNAVRGAYSPRSPSNAMGLSKEQIIAEAREIERFLRHKPAHFRKVCDGWDMMRKLEVDFGADNGEGAGEGIFVVSRGVEKEIAPRVVRYARTITPQSQDDDEPLNGPEVPGPKPSTAQSIFGPSHISPSLSGTTASPARGERAVSSGSMSPVNKGLRGATKMDDWNETILNLKSHANSEITATGIDLSLQAALTAAEDHKPAGVWSELSGLMSPQTAEASSEIPGRRARMFAVGTKGGAIVVWNARERATRRGDLVPVRIMQTDSPEISCLALTALYLVHGGSDGLVQAWDPLASTLDPVRTLNARPSGRAPRHMIAMNPALRDTNHSVVGAIYLDPDPTVLRGVLSFGSFLRYWSYSSAPQPAGRKRRHRHSDMHGRHASRRIGGAVAGYIAAEAAELRREQAHRSQEEARLQRRFGVGALGDLTEEEAIRYAQMMSEESFLLDEQRRTSASDTGSAADAALDTTSSFSGSMTDTMTPEPSITGLGIGLPTDTDEDDYELQIQRALRLSLLEGVNDSGQSPRANSSAEYEFPVKYRSSKSAKQGRSPSGSPSRSRPALDASNPGTPSRSAPTPREHDLELALGAAGSSAGVGLGIREDDFPPLGGRDKGKGVGRK